MGYAHRAIAYTRLPTPEWGKGPRRHGPAHRTVRGARPRSVPNAGVDPRKSREPRGSRTEPTVRQMTVPCGATLRPAGNNDDRLWRIYIPSGHNAGDTGQRRTRTLRRTGQPLPRSTGMMRHRYPTRMRLRLLFAPASQPPLLDPLSALQEEKPTPPPRGLPGTVQLKAMTTTGSAKPPTTGTMSPSRTNGDHGRHEQQSWHCRGQPAPSVRGRPGSRVLQPAQQSLAPVHHQAGHCFRMTIGTPTTAEHHERPVNEIRSTDGPIDPIQRIA